MPYYTIAVFIITDFYFQVFRNVFKVLAFNYIFSFFLNLDVLLHDICTLECFDRYLTFYLIVYILSYEVKQ